MRKLNVAIVAPSLRILGGQAVQADQLLRAWRDDPEVNAWLVPIDPLPPGPLRYATRLKYIRTLVTQLVYTPLLVRELAKADVVHVFSASYSSFLLAPLPAMIVAAAWRRPVVLHYHSGEAPDHLARSAVARFALARTAANVVPSQFLVDVFGSFGLPALSIANVVDTGRFRFREPGLSGARLLSTRNLDDNYDVATTLRAFRLVHDRHPDATLTVVGDGPHRGRLHALAAELGIGGVVTFVGRVAPDRMPACYASHDLYVQSPAVDNMPLSVLEAFATGIPVVSTGAGGVPAIVAHGRTGLLSPVGDAAALARSVLQLLDDPASARRMALEAHRGMEAFSWPAVRNQWLDLYRSVLDAAPAHARPSPSHAG